MQSAAARDEPETIDLCGWTLAMRDGVSTGKSSVRLDPKAAPGENAQP